jgi:hypothetical protein
MILEREDGQEEPPPKRSRQETLPTDSSLFLTSTMAEDVDILEKYLISTTKSSNPPSKPYNAKLSTPGNPIVYLKIPRRREGLHSVSHPGKIQREVMEQILGPLKWELIKV